MKKFQLTVVIILSVILTACQSSKQESYSRTEIALDTVNQIQIYQVDDHQDIEKILDKAFNYLFTMEKQLSAYQAGSDIDRLNQSAGSKAVRLQEDSLALIQLGLDYGKISPEQILDISIGPLSRLWKDHLQQDQLPSAEAIKQAQAKVNDQFIDIHPQNQTASLKEEGMAIDLGAIAKGYLADQLARLLKEQGVESAVINLGGNVKLLGSSPRPSGRWQVGIQNPFESSGDLLATVELEELAVSTSGIYQRYIEKDGQIYHHLINPQTGYPFDNELAAVSIIAPTSLQADAYSTLVFGLGLEEGLELINQTEGVEAVLIDRQNGVHTSQALKDLELIDDNYNLVV